MSVVAIAKALTGGSSSSTSQEKGQKGNEHEMDMLEHIMESMKSHEIEDHREDDHGDIEDENDVSSVDLGPIIPLKQQLELDKEDESLRRWKEQLLGSLQIDDNGAEMEPQVNVLTLGIVADGRPDIILSLPFTKSKGHAFTLKEGSCYRLCFKFLVSHNIVSGLTYVNTVWRNGIRVDHTRAMLGTFGPQAEPYTHYTDEEITPSGILARGSYSAKTKFLDDDKRCYLELEYTFDIRKDWH